MFLDAHPDTKEWEALGWIFLCALLRVHSLWAISCRVRNPIVYCAAVGMQGSTHCFTPTPGQAFGVVAGRTTSGSICDLHHNNVVVQHKCKSLVVLFPNAYTSLFVRHEHTPGVGCFGTVQSSAACRFVVLPC